jgi:hypothetical protein
MKKIVSALLMTVMLLSILPTTSMAANDSVTAVKTEARIEVDGKINLFNGYMINGNNYVKLRDIASILTGTAKQFDVAWDGEKNAIRLLSGKPYTPVGGELALTYIDETKRATPSTAKVYLDNNEIRLTAYTIDGNNYFKLRDLADTMDFYIEWDEARGVVELETLFGYVPENAGDSYSLVRNLNAGNTQQTIVSNWASISPVQQFPYKNEGLAYAYVKDNRLIIATPGKQLSVEMKSPLLGDVISDEDGNFYIVWGRENPDDEPVETIFISKYSPEGRHIKSTGFVGQSPLRSNYDAGKMKAPFWAGNSVSVIADGVLVNYHTKRRYDGHQSDSVIAVKISDMSVYPWPNDAYSGHSFNQSVIYSKKTSGILFASQGDAFPRGFRINDSNGKYGDQKDVVFHFYLQPNANYDMRIVNQTFAQLGGIAETSKGVVLVGASAKSIGEAAKTEKQNLFVQIFDPLAEEWTPSAFIGGTVRSGATSFDIYDNQNGPLTKVTDYGVIWLTDYTDKNAIAPQVVAADDRIVILWGTDRLTPEPESFYMVLSAEGEVITPATSLGRVKLNSYERPIYHNGQVYWAYTDKGNLRVFSIKP